MSTMPIRSMKPPTVIAAQPNGAVNPALLSRIDRDGYLWQFAALPARGMLAMRAAIHAALGVTLDTTGRGRTLDMQWTIFGGSQARYRPCTLAEYNTNHALGQELTKLWPTADRHAVAALLHVTIPESDYWTKITLAGGGHPATAAVPGTSPHGLWCADDLALPDGPDADKNVDGLSEPVFEWLCAHALDYGFAASTTSERWHWQWYVGDTVPAAVLAFEASQHQPPPVEQPPTQPPIQEDHDMAKIIQCDPSVAPGPPAGDQGAVFTVTGIIAAWVDNPGDLATAQRHGVAPAISEVELWPRDDFHTLRLIGALPPGWAGSDFREVIG